MKIFESFIEGGVLLLWLIVVLIHSLSKLIDGNDYSASNNSIITFIMLGLLQTQIMIKQEIQKLKDEL